MSFWFPSFPIFPNKNQKPRKMNFDIIKKIPILARETKDKFSKALTTLQTDESSYFFNESLNKEQILEFLNSKYNAEILSALKKIIAVSIFLY